MTQLSLIHAGFMIDYKHLIPNDPKSIYEKNYEELRKRSLLTIYYHAYQKTRCFDIAGDIYLDADSIIDRLLSKFFKQDETNYLIHYLLKITQNLLKNKYRVKQRKEKKEEIIFFYAMSERQYFTPSNNENDSLDMWEELQNELKRIIKYSTNEMKLYIYLKFDLEIVKEDQVLLEKLLERKGIPYDEWQNKLEEKRLKFYTTKAKYLQKIGFYTFQLIGSKDKEERKLWKDRKKKKLKQLQNLMDRGLFSNRELADLFNVAASTLAKRWIYFKKGGWKKVNLSPPKESKMYRKYAA